VRAPPDTADYQPQIFGRPQAYFDKSNTADYFQENNIPGEMAEGASDNANLATVTTAQLKYFRT
jgi:hypothetical protein